MPERVHEHLFTSDEKLSWWGNGEWVEEEDLVYWEYKGIKCKVQRVAFADRSGHMFGGHLCGYIQIPLDHPWASSDPYKIDCSVHGGITYGKKEGDGNYWIGFDCGHSMDIVPSTEKHFRRFDDYLEFEKRFSSICPQIFQRSYKNIAFCIGECEDLVDQLLDINNIEDIVKNLKTKE